MKKIIAALVFAVCFSANAQKAETTEPTPFIEVTGTAEKEVVPDIIYISITLQDKVVNKSEYTIAAQEERLKKALKELNIDLKNLSLGGASSNIVYHKKKEKGVSQRQEYRLKVSTAAEIKGVFEALYNSDIKEAYVESTDHSQMDALRKEVRTKAIKAAKEKATYLLEAIGEAPGKPLVIKEENGNVYRANAALSNVAYEEFKDADAEVGFENITIKFSYYVKYAIK